MLFFVPMAALAGDISGGVSPTTAGGGAMNTLEDIYNLINLGTTNSPRAGIFVEPAAGPLATGHTLTEVYTRATTSSRPAKTGQTPTAPISAPVGSDGALQKGVAWPNPRFTASNGTVTDNLTGLIWLKNANCFGDKNWATALTDCNNLASPACGLTDNSTAGQWRLPNYFELVSLLDLAYFTPALSNDAGTSQWGTGPSSFTGVQSVGYWSSSTVAAITGNAWYVLLHHGYVYDAGKTATRYVWPVRVGQ